MLNEDIIDRHYKRLYKFYIGKGLSPENSVFYTKQKISKLLDVHSELSYYGFLRNLFNSSYRDCVIKDVLDVGCGSGEMVIIGRLLGYNVFGTDIYLEELDLAKELATDLGLDDKIFFHNLPVERKFDLSVMFSVLEHVPYGELESLIGNCIRISNFGVFSIHPNRFKFIDDHTRLPGLGLFNHRMVKFFFKYLGIEYSLSENREWDVYLRSFNELESELSCFDISMLKDDEIYPPLKFVPKLSLRKYSGINSVLNNAYFAFVKIFYLRCKEDFYPYHCVKITLK